MLLKVLKDKVTNTLKKEESLKESKKEKIVILNSGGFDSICLINYVAENFSDCEIHSLHFHYGALNEKQQQKCVDKVCKKLGVINKIIDLPNFDWTNSNFYAKDEYSLKTQYLEYRNLVFLAYAISYAEAIGAQYIGLAVLNGGNYADTNSKFIKGLNTAIWKSGIKIETPFINSTKDDLILFAVKYGISSEDFFSCDKPKEDGTPCGTCIDCEATKKVLDVLKVDAPIKAFIQGGYQFDNPVFKTLLKKSVRPIFEVRALINNSCQLKCRHCFYGFDTMKGKALSKEEYYAVLKDFVTTEGVKNIHFSGKEPLYDDTLIWYAEQIKKDKLPCTFDLVSNGINVPKYVGTLKNLGMHKIFLSVDDVLSTNGVRKIHGVTEKALNACNEVHIPVQVFIDLHEHNYNKLDNIIDYLVTRYGVKEFHIRTIRTIGNGSTLKNTLTGAQLNESWVSLKEIAKKNPAVKFEFSVSIEYMESLNDTELLKDIDVCELLYSCSWSDNLEIFAEEFCQRYQGNVTLTPDGYLLGCASEVSLPNYDEVSVGNVRDHSIKELLEKGAEESYCTNDVYCGRDNLKCRCCYFNK